MRYVCKNCDFDQVLEKKRVYCPECKKKSLIEVEEGEEITELLAFSFLEGGDLMINFDYVDPVVLASLVCCIISGQVTEQIIETLREGMPEEDFIAYCESVSQFSKGMIKENSKGPIIPPSQLFISRPEE